MRVRHRFWPEIGIAMASGLLGLLTIVVPDWIEVLTGMEPDRGDGSLELIVALSLLLVAVLSAGLARREWRRAGVLRAPHPTP